MKTSAIERCLKLIGFYIPYEEKVVREAKDELRMLLENIAEQAVMIKALGGDAPEPDYSKLSDFTKVMLLASCDRPGDVTAVHDDQMATSMVHHPKHYNTGKYEVIDVIEDWNLDFNLGNAVKYIARAEHKDKKKEDLEKAIWYLQRVIK